MNHLTQDEEEREKRAAVGMAEAARLFQPVIDKQIAMGIPEPFLKWYSKVPSVQVAEVFLSFLSDGGIPNEGMGEGVRGGMARSLGAECAYPYFDQIVGLYKAEKKHPRDFFGAFGVKDCLAAAIVEHALRHKGVQKIFETVLELASDEESGLVSRETFLFNFLRKSKDSRAHELIKHLALHSPDQRVRERFKIKDWKSYWMKREPELYKQWEAEAKAMKKTGKKAS